VQNKNFSSAKHLAKVISYDEFQKICQNALIPSAKPNTYVMTLQSLKKPALDILYRVIYIENKLSGR
jgi:hypothetical protein